MEIPSNLKYTKDHEWLNPTGDAVTVGITEFAQSELGEIVFCDLPAVGKVVKKGETLCVVESTKAASDVYAPVSGTVTAVNTALSDDPSKINSAPYGDGWMVKLSGVDSADLGSMMSAEQYKNLVG